MTDSFDLDGPNPWQTRSSGLIFHNGRLHLFEDQVIQPDGEPGTYTYVELPGPIVGIVPVSEDGHVYLVRQWRYPWRCNAWEIPAGHGEPPEDPLQAAQRELAEEVGLQAVTWDTLGTVFSSALISTSYHLFLARGLSPASVEHHLDGSEQDMITRRFPLAEAVEAALDGRIQGALGIVGLLRAARRLGA